MLKKLGINRNIFALGIVSFLNDIASEMIYPLVPIFLTTALGAPVAVVGIIEGIAESTASVFKMVFGWLSDRMRRRKGFVVAGYLFSSFSKIILGLAYLWPLVLLGRFIDRTGKGVRTAARDALISENATVQNRGKAFGFHRGLDTTGAVLGPLLALLFIANFQDELRTVFLFAAIPSFLGVFLLILVVKEKRKEKQSKNNRSQPFKFRWKALSPSFRIFLLISVVFALGNSSDAFLILRAQNLGLATTLTLLAYVSYNASFAIFSTPAGSMADKIGAKRVLISGFIIFALVYLAFGLISHSIFIWILFPFYGIYMAFTEGVGKAYIANLIKPEKLGTAYGAYNMAVGLCTFFASFMAGLFWTYISPSAPFYFGALMAFLAAIIFILLEKRMNFQAPKKEQGQASRS